MAPKQTLTIGGAALEYAKSGDGSPAIVLVNGSGGPIEGWFRLHAQLAALSTVFAYNRRGVGASGKPHEAQTGDVIVRDLRELLTRAGLTPPYLLVSHSLGGPAMAWATPAAAREARAEHQRRLAALSPQGRQVIAERSGHFPPFTQPELVVQAVHEVLSLARASDPPCRESSGPQC